MEIAEQLTRASFREVEVDGIVWRLQLLDPALAAEAGIFMEMVATASTARMKGDLPTQVDERRAIGIQGNILQACIRGAGRVGQPIEPIQVVQQADQQDAKKGRIWVGALMSAKTSQVGLEGVSLTLASILTVQCLVQIREAQEALRPFRLPAEGPLATGSSGSPVRANAC